VTFANAGPDLQAAARSCCGRRDPGRSGGVAFVQRGSVGDADDQAILGEKPGHRLSPRLCARWVQQLKARALKLTARPGDRLRVLYFKLD